jgi:thioredoxin 1
LLVRNLVVALSEKFNKLNMRKIFAIIVSASILLFNNCNAGSPTKPEQTGGIIHLTDATFKEKVFNYSLNKQWKFEGDKPAIIDFYATWCGPCRMMSPIIEQVAKEYGDKIVVYKVDTDEERVLAQSLGIQSLPTLLFIPLNGQPQASMGAIPKESLVKAINDVLLVK